MFVCTFMFGFNRTNSDNYCNLARLDKSRAFILSHVALETSFSWWVAASVLFRKKKDIRLGQRRPASKQRSPNEVHAQHQILRSDGIRSRCPLCAFFHKVILNVLLATSASLTNFGKEKSCSTHLGYIRSYFTCPNHRPAN